MPQIVQKFQKATIEAMRTFYEKSLVEAPNGALFRAKTTHSVITGYRSGKVLFQGASPEQELNKWTDGTKREDTKKTHSTPPEDTAFHPPEKLFSSSHIGSDEAGTGDYFGPITVGAAYVSHEMLPRLKAIGVKDSKNLSDKQIQAISSEIIALQIPYTLLVVPNEKYNTLQQKGWTQGKMKAMLHHRAIKSLLTKLNDKPLDGILIDQFCKPAVYKRHLASENEVLPEKIFFKTKAENDSIAVAAGSILARTRFVQEIDRLSEEAGMVLPKGASQKVDKAAAKVKQKFGDNHLKTCAKVHFANTHKANAYL